MLTDAQVQGFIADGFVKVEGAFPRELADACREILWRESGCDPDDPGTWTRPVIRLGEHGEEPFARAVNTPVLHAAFDRLVGAGRWFPRNSLGSFPVRFPATESPGDDGWHLDVSFPGDDPTDYFTWRVNLHSRGRALLMLFLFSDVTDDDAPTRISSGSHLRIARQLRHFDDDGATLGHLDFPAAIADLPVTLATGHPGDVYLCHPFLVHAAQPHRGHTPRFLAQPPLILRTPCVLDRADGDHSPLEQAINLGLDT
ncbi:phytanoyl-CoA dioxygenase family protein [Nocardia jejuensis]|uniref:phytanoyl-CoA dioxygenase family protein n=1 Tax=Nocardia jejuensis TaxID=328049 RepID=UPI00082C2076|nr:phytanoyl-CoA dioxygenase family protein [Nocardia jejuensis]